jgi:hypothetical protein
MAVINRNTLVLNSVSVVRDVTSTVVTGFVSTRGEIAAIPFSMRPPSHRYAQAGQKASPRQVHVARGGADSPADRAGRPEGSGVLASRSLAWIPAMGGTCPTVAWRFGRFTAKHPASVGNVLPERHLASRVEALGNGNLLRLPPSPWGRRHGEAGLAGLEPASEVRSTSARGA